MLDDKVNSCSYEVVCYFSLFNHPPCSVLSDLSKNCMDAKALQITGE